MDAGPDPAPVHCLRALLDRARRDGREWSPDLYLAAVRAAVAGLADDDRLDWIAALIGTEPAWERAYAGEPTGHGLDVSMIGDPETVYESAQLLG